jgi:hypothetical protein
MTKEKVLVMSRGLGYVPPHFQSLLLELEGERVYD